MKRLKKILPAVFLVLILLVSPVYAQQKPGSGLSIQPTLSPFTLKPGQGTNLTITLKNITSNDITAQASVKDFKADDNLTGTPQILPDSNEPSPHSIKKFVSGLKDLSLKPSEQKQVPLTINVPGDSPPGAYYGVIVYKAIPTGTNAPKSGEVALSASVGSIVLITVPGNIHDQIQLTGIHIYKGDSEGVFFANKPTNAGIEIKNLGNGFAQPFGNVVLQNIFGKQVYSYQLNNTNPRGSILPDSSRIFKQPLKGIKTPGRYTLIANVSSTNGSDVIVLKKTFWYIPIWLIAVVIAVIVAIVLVILWSRRRYRVAVKRFRKK